MTWLDDVEKTTLYVELFFKLHFLRFYLFIFNYFLEILKYLREWMKVGNFPKIIKKLKIKLKKM